MDQAIVTSNNVTPVVQIIAWLLLIFAIICVLTQLGIKVGILRKIALDDALISIALLFAIGQTLAVYLATSDGLGQRANTISQFRVSGIMKAQYAANLLYIPSLCFAKLALLSVLYKISPVTWDRRIISGVGLFIITWATIAVVVEAFQCQTPQTWVYLDHKCINRTIWITYFESVNIITDLLLIASPTKIIISTTATFKRKAYNIAAFWARIVIIPASVCRIVYWPSLIADASFDTWQATICVQFVQSLEIIATCTIYLRPLLDTMDSGFSRTDDLRRRGDGSGSASRHGGYNLSASIPLETLKRSRLLSSGTARGIPYGETTARAERTAEPHTTDNASENSRSHIITQTTTFEVSSSQPGLKRERSSEDM